MGTCSCGMFHEQNICHHVLAVGYLFKQIEPDAEALDAISLDKKPKRGRKPKVASALIID